MPFVIAFVLALVLTPVVGRFAVRVGLMDRPVEGLKIHTKPVPVLGGVAVAVSAFGALALLGDGPRAAVLVAVGIALGAGLLDDTKPLPPWARLIFQAGAGSVLIAGGFRVEPLGALGAAGAMILVVACANATNMLDGQDGLAGGLAAIAAIGLSGLATRLESSPAAGLALAVGGALVGFTVWNRSPARIFLGNGGAYAAGTLLAVVALSVATEGGWRALLAVGVCLGVFAFEIIFTVIRRSLSGSPIVPGDRFHSYDILAAGNGDRRRVTVMFWVFGLVAAGLGLLVGSLPLAGGIVVTTLGCLAASVVGIRLYSRLARRTHGLA